jgi:hypothetical protein
MSKAIADLDALLGSMDPTLHECVYAYCVVPANADVAPFSPMAMVRESEGVTLIVTEGEAIAAGLPVLFRAARITLTVHSDLEAVGLTAAFSGALARAGIGCNVVAGAFHDHIFVPAEMGRRALAVLRELTASSRPQSA